MEERKLEEKAKKEGHYKPTKKQIIQFLIENTHLLVFYALFFSLFKI
jgi:hypothetical protein